MSSRFCRVCRDFHDLEEPWPNACFGHFQANSRGGLQIIKDIEPYQAVAADVATGSAPVIKSRREHREFLKRNGYVEVGNEFNGGPRPRKHVEIDSPRPELTAAVREVLGRRK
jgi:hypothetical protein